MTQKMTVNEYADARASGELGNPLLNTTGNRDHVYHRTRRWLKRLGIWRGFGQGECQPRGRSKRATPVYDLQTLWEAEAGLGSPPPPPDGPVSIPGQLYWREGQLYAVAPDGSSRVFENEVQAAKWLFGYGQNARGG